MHDSVHERLKAAIHDAGFTIKKFSELSGVPYRTLQGYLSGKREPGAINLRLMAPHLGVSLHWLLTGEGNMMLSSDKSGEPLEHALIKEEQAEYNFTLDIHGQIAEHNVAIIKRLVRKMLHIFLKDGDYRKTGAVQSVIDAVGPKEEKDG